jgi:hypothetical protein
MHSAKGFRIGERVKGIYHDTPIEGKISRFETSTVYPGDGRIFVEFDSPVVLYGTPRNGVIVGYNTRTMAFDTDDILEVVK